ncbi:MAG: hypothetical protein N6V49_12795, partial [Serratia symbiotica]|nr:hypothetical protein [Serratia symbiotica]
NLPLKVKKKTLVKEFSKFGEVESVRVRSVPILDVSVRLMIIYIYIYIYFFFGSFGCMFFFVVIIDIFLISVLMFG